MIKSNECIRMQLSRLWGHLSRERKSQLFMLLLLMALASVFEVVSIAAVIPFLAALTSPERLLEIKIFNSLYSHLNYSSPREMISLIAFVFIGAAIISGVIRLSLLWMLTKISYSIGEDIGNNIYRKTLYQSYEVHLSRNSGDVIAGISSKANVIVSYTILPFLNMVSSALLICLIIISLIYVNPTVSVAAVVSFGVIYAGIVWYSKDKLRCYGETANEATSNVLRALQEGLGGIREVLIDASQETFCKIYRDADTQLRRAQAKIQVLTLGPRFLIETLGVVVFATIAYLLSMRDQGLSIAIPFLGALALAAQRLLPALQQAYSGWVSIRAGAASLSDTLLLLDQQMPSDVGGGRVDFTREITLSEVAFKYNCSGQYVLTGVDLSILKGEMVGIVGKTGGGKSTLLDIIMGLLKPTAGVVKIDGNVIDTSNCKGWQQHIAHVPQSIYLVDATIAENIAFGLNYHEIDFDRVRKAADRAQLSSTVDALEKKYDTLVGERGVRLSGGQRQRIGIARALYKSADVIIFDEATSALDATTEKSVIDAFDKIDEELTIIMVAHRLTTLSRCSKILEVENGCVRYIGTYDQYMSGQEIIGLH